MKHILLSLGLTQADREKKRTSSLEARGREEVIHSSHNDSLNPPSHRGHTNVSPESHRGQDTCMTQPESLHPTIASHIIVLDDGATLTTSYPQKRLARRALSLIMGT